MSTPRAGRSRHHSRRSSISKSAPTSCSATDFIQHEPLLEHEPEPDLNDVPNEKAAAMAAESEVQNLLMARVGGWLEWAVGWMDFRDDDSDDDDDNDDNEFNGDINAANDNRLSAIASRFDKNEHGQIQRGVDFRERMEAPRAPLDVMNIGEGPAMKYKIKITTADSESKLDSWDLNGDESGPGHGAILHAGIPLPSPTYPKVSSPLETAVTAGARTEAGTRAGSGNWAGVHDVWWGDAKWLFGVAGRDAW